MQCKNKMVNPSDQPWSMYLTSICLQSSSWAFGTFSVSCCPPAAEPWVTEGSERRRRSELVSIVSIENGDAMPPIGWMTLLSRLWGWRFTKAWQTDVKKVKVCFYTAQSVGPLKTLYTSHLLAELFIPTPTRLLWEAFWPRSNSIHLHSHHRLQTCTNFTAEWTGASWRERKCPALKW